MCQIVNEALPTFLSVTGHGCFGVVVLNLPNATTQLVPHVYGDPQA